MSARLDDLLERTEAGAARFGDRFAERAGADQAELTEELRHQVRPLVQALLEAAAGGGAGPELREALALASLLGRRAAALGATPTATSRIAPALGRALDAAEPHVEALREVILEGFVSEREDALALEGARRAAGAVPVVELVPGCVLMLLQGDQAAHELEALGEELGRTLLERDARALVVHARGLRRPDRERAGHLFAIHGTCVMLGVRCAFSAVGPDWVDAAEERGVALSDVRLVETLDAALEDSLAACGYVLGPRPALERVWRQLTGKS